MSLPIDLDVYACTRCGMWSMFDAEQNVWSTRSGRQHPACLHCGGRLQNAFHTHVRNGTYPCVICGFAPVVRERAVGADGTLLLPPASDT